MSPLREPTDERRNAIHAAAVQVFSERGFAGTSMSHIATEAGMSRPALYQYFENKADLFAAAFAALIDEHVDRSLASLRVAGSIESHLDNFLQRFDGDLWERLANSPHATELMDVKSAHTPDAAAHGLARLRRGLAAYLKSTGAPAAARTEWTDVLRLAPQGFKTDQPSVRTYRRRLFALARSVAADITTTRR